MQGWTWVKRMLRYYLRKYYHNHLTYCRFAFYKHGEDSDVLTRYFGAGEQMGFDLMIGLISHNGIDVAVEESLILDISSEQFYNLHVSFPADFGLLMINLSRELAREISMLEDVIGKGTGWLGETAS